MGLNLAMSLEQLLFSVLSALFAIAVHEYAHGVVAYKLGDPTPKVLGRLTLNPLKHLDPIGLLMLVLFRVGWAKPVEINSLRFKNRRRGVVLVALAGPLANVTVAWVLNLLSFLCCACRSAVSFGFHCTLFLWSAFRSTFGLLLLT